MECGLECGECAFEYTEFVGGAEQVSFIPICGGFGFAWEGLGA